MSKIKGSLCCSTSSKHNSEYNNRGEKQNFEERTWRMPGKNKIAEGINAQWNASETIARGKQS